MFCKSPKFLFFPAPVTSVKSPRLLIAVDLSSSKLRFGSCTVYFHAGIGQPLLLS